MSKIRLTFTDEQIHKWFNSIHTYKELIHRRYLNDENKEIGNMVEPSRGVVFMPHWKKQDQCFEEEHVEVTDYNGRRVTKNSKPVIKAWPHDKPIAQISYENWLEQVVNPDSNEWYPARNKDDNPIKGTGAKHIITQIIRLRRKDGSEFLYS
jgi:hypothetical protein